MRSPLTCSYHAKAETVCGVHKPVIFLGIISNKTRHRETSEWRGAGEISLEDLMEPYSCGSSCGSDVDTSATTSGRAQLFLGKRPRIAGHGPLHTLVFNE
jgi:hypothetical protein